MYHKSIKEDLSLNVECFYLSDHLYLLLLLVTHHHDNNLLTNEEVYLKGKEQLQQQISTFYRVLAPARRHKLRYKFNIEYTKVVLSFPFCFCEGSL